METGWKRDGNEALGALIYGLSRAVLGNGMETRWKRGILDGNEGGHFRRLSFPVRAIKHARQEVAPRLLLARADERRAF